LVALTWLSVASGDAAAQAPRPGELTEEGCPRPPRGPPPEALAACTDLAAGEACTVVVGELLVEGSCRSGPRGTEPLACAPQGRPPPPAPPPEALAACTDLAAGEACTVTVGDLSIEGSCRSGPRGTEPLACVPDGGPPPPPVPPEAFAACAELSLDAACALNLGPGTILGTCRTGPMGTEPLACVPEGGPPPPPPCRWDERR
jgi:hypothetical protein